MSEGPEPTRKIPDPGFAGDEGGPDPELTAALASYAVDPGRTMEVLARLTAARLLVPVVALLGESEAGDDGLSREKTSDMATVLLTGRDGRRALLAFTGLTALHRWRPDARPVPVAASLAARSALHEGADALVLDVAGPAPYAVEGEALVGLAQGWELARTSGGYAWVTMRGASEER